MAYCQLAIRPHPNPLPLGEGVIPRSPLGEGVLQGSPLGEGVLHRSQGSDLMSDSAFGGGIVAAYNPCASDDEVTVEFSGGVEVKRLLLGFVPPETLDD